MRAKTIANVVVALGLGGVLAVSDALASEHQVGREMGPLGAMKHFEEMDANGDGQVTREEMMAHREARFAETDANGDGMLSEDEIVTAMTARAAKRVQEHAARMIAMFDADGDGMIARAEMGRVDRGEMMFRRMDADGNGVISAEERRAGMHRDGKWSRHGMMFGHDREGHRGEVPDNGHGLSDGGDG